MNTITWIAALGVCIIGVFRLLRYFKITIDQQFVTGVACYVLFGSSLRVLEDADIFSPPLQYIFITPIIYFVVFFITMISLAVSLQIHKEQYHRMFSDIGLVLTSVTLCTLLWHERITHPVEALLIVTLAALITGSIYLIAEHMNIKFLRDKLNMVIVGSYLLYTFSIAVGTKFLGYHGGYPLKLLVFIPALYLIDSEFDDDEIELRDLLKLVILVLGLAPACRNTLRILFGV